MRIARSGQYAIQALLDLATTKGGTVGDIAHRTNLPEPFLHQLVAQLRGAGLLTTKRGPGGGIKLAKSVEEISLLSVLDAVGIRDEVEESGWINNLPEPHRSRLQGIDRLLPDELEVLTLADLIPRSAVHAQADFARAIAEVLPPRKLLDYIGHHAVAVTGADRCAVYFGGRDFGYVTTAIEMREEVAVTLPESPERLTRSWVPYKPVGAVAVAWMTGHQVIISDTLSDERASPEIAERFQIRSVLATPIHAGPDGSGVLVLAKGIPNFWTESHISRASELATIAGFAIVGHSQMAGVSAGHRPHAERIPEIEDVIERRPAK